MISTSFITNSHTLLALALQTARQIEVNGNSIQIDSPAELIIPSRTANSWIYNIQLYFVSITSRPKHVTCPGCVLLILVK